MKFISYPDQDMMMIDVANQLAGALNEHVMLGERASFAVPGGTTPGPIFDVLCAADLDWSQVDILPTDERRVPPDHPRSNERLIRERLMVGRAAAARFVSIVPSGEMQEADAANLPRLLDGLLPINVLLLGMGADMHTASLFPGSAQLAAALDDDAPALMPVEAPGAPEPRITLTAPVLEGAMSKHLVITGAEKRAALERAQKLDDPVQAPICAVLGGTTVHWAA